VRSLDSGRRTDENTEIGGDALAFGTERRQHSPDGKQDWYRVGCERRSVGMDGDTDNAGIGPAREIARRMSMDRLQTSEQQQHAQTAKRSPLSWGLSLD